MNEKSITFTILAVVAIVAVSGFVLQITGANTGNYIAIGRAYEALGARTMGSGTQTSEVEYGLYTGGTETTPSATKKTSSERDFDLNYLCYPLEDGKQIQNPQAPNTVLWGSLQTKESTLRSESQIMLTNCYLEFIVPNTSKHAQNELDDFICCISGSTGPLKSSLGGSVGKAYYTQ